MSVKLAVSNQTRVIQWHSLADELALDALVLEEDTGLVLSAPISKLPAASEPAIRVMTALYDFREPVLGDVRVRRSPETSYRVLLAVVHDFGAPNTLLPSSISTALHEVFALCEHWRLCRIAMQPLGAVHGDLSTEEFLVLLRECLHLAPVSLDTIWVLQP